MNNVYIRSNINLKKIILTYILALTPLLLAGFYKNGIKLYIDDYVSLSLMFKPLILDILGFGIGLFVNLIYDKVIKKEKGSVFSSFHPLYGLLIASIISINTNILLFIGVTFIVLFISKFIKNLNINVVAVAALIIIFITKYSNGFTFLNIYEQTNKLSLNSLDYLIGRGSGGINTTHVILLVLSLIILCKQNYYKKEIPLYSTIVYSISMLGYCIFNNNIGAIFDNIFTNGILFSFVFIGTDSLSSSYTSKGKIVYSVILGLVTFGLYLIYPPLSSIGGILIASICHITIDRLCER